MDRESLLAEIAAQDREPSEEMITMLVDMSMIAYQALASPPGGADLARMAYIGGVIRTRSTKPRVVLRKLIAVAGERHGYVPGEQVCRAAGLATPRVPHPGRSAG